MTVQEPEYHVAFVYTAECNGYEGVVTWTSFPSKEAFDDWYTDDIRERQRVVEEGITKERAGELVKRTPLACYFASAIQDATRPDGTIDQGLLEFKLENVASIAKERNRN
mgnify:CR=1 FL=1